MGTKGSVFTDAAGYVCGRAVHLSDYTSTARVNNRGSVTAETSFYVPDKDFMGTLRLHPSQLPVKTVRRRPDGSVELDLHFIETVDVIMPQEAFLQALNIYRGVETTFASLAAIQKDVEKHYDQYVTDWFKPGVGPQPEDKSAFPFHSLIAWYHSNGISKLAASSILGRGCMQIGILHQIRNVDPYTFSTIRSRAGSESINNTILDRRNHVLRFQLSGDNVVWKGGGWDGVEDYSLSYSRTVVVSDPVGFHSPITSVLMNPKAHDSLAIRPVTADTFYAPMEGMAERIGPTFMTWDSVSGENAAGNGIFLPGPDSDAVMSLPYGDSGMGLTWTLLEGPSNVLGVGSPYSEVLRQRLIETRLFCQTAALIAAELYTADLEVGYEKADGSIEPMGIIKTPDRAMAEDLPYSIFQPNGTKIRSFVQKAMNDDSYLF